MSKTRVEHCVMINHGMQCLHCGDIHVLPGIAMPIDIITNLLESFPKRHAKCKPTYQPPTIDSGMLMEHRIKFWLRHGERGSSVMAMFNRFMPANKFYGESDTAHPYDPDDFRRCYLFLKAVPEFKLRLNVMKDISDVWEKLVDNWDKLTHMLETGLASKEQSSAEMYNLMKELGC